MRTTIYLTITYRVEVPVLNELKIQARPGKILMQFPDGNISAVRLTVPYNRLIHQYNA